MQFDVNPERIIDSDGDLYLVSGRIPFDDDDTVTLVQARDEARAIEGFRQNMADMRPDYEPQNEDNPLGEPDIYVNISGRIGTLIKEQ